VGIASITGEEYETIRGITLMLDGVDEPHLAAAQIERFVVDGISDPEFHLSVL